MEITFIRSLNKLIEPRFPIKDFLSFFTPLETDIFVKYGDQNMLRIMQNRLQFRAVYLKAIKSAVNKRIAFSKLCHLRIFIDEMRAEKIVET